MNIADNFSKRLNLYQKMAQIRQVISVSKTGFNAHGNYNYFEIDQIYKGCKELFCTYNIFTTFNLIFDPEVNQYRATLTVIDADNPDQQFTMSIDSPLNQLRGAASASQCVGSNNTYQAKYLYMDLLMLDDGSSDPDKTNTHGKKPIETVKQSVKDEFFSSNK